MQQVALHTPQNIEINFPIAELGKRFLAKAIDYTIIIILFKTIEGIFESIYGRSVWEYDYWELMAIFILLFLPVYSYSFWMEALLRGRTVGKLLMKLQVVRLDGEPYSWENALIRWMFFLVDWFPAMGIVGFIAVSASEKSQRLGDLAAETVVISTKKEVGIDQTILLELEKGYQPTYNQVIRLSDNDMRIIKEAFENALKNKDLATLKKLRNKIESVILTTDTSKNDTDFIRTVMQDFNYYTNQ